MLAGSLDYEATLRHDRQAGRARRRRLVRRRPRRRRPGRGRSASRSRTSTRRRSRWRSELAERYPAEPRTDRGAAPGARAPASRSCGREIPDELIVEAAQDEEHLRADPRARDGVGDDRADARARPRARRDLVRERGVGPDASTHADLRLAEDLALRAARGGRERAAATARARRSRRRCRRRCCRRCCPRSRASTPARSTARRARTTRSAATSTTCSPPAEDHWFAVIGDVCGKGAEAAAVTALARYTIRAAAVRRRSPAAILRWVNEAMLREDARRASARSPARTSTARPAAAT